MARPRKYATDEERDAARKASKQRHDRKRPEHGGKHTYERIEWEPHFIGVDGESFATKRTLPDGSPRQDYCLLLRSDKDSLYKPGGISTWDALCYLTDGVPPKTALVGYFLNFDFEWILKDLSQKEYKDLQHGETVPLFAGDYVLQWFVGKKLVIYRLMTKFRHIQKDDRKLNKHYRMVTIQDVQGFFQQSFVAALKKWGFADDPRLNIITTGKAARGGFQHDDVDDVAAYNAMEMELLEELMMKVYDSFKAAYEAVGLDFRVNSQTWSGPGVFANDFLKQTLWNEEHAPPSDHLRHTFGRKKQGFFGNEVAEDYPFSLAYYGGRIELAAIGKFEAAYNYDVNSAYPYALSLLPRWTADDFAYVPYVGRVIDKDVEAYLSRRLMGMYTVRFAFPEGWTWYPFPVRDYQYGGPNVFYPRQGLTHVMGPELFAVLDSLPPEDLQYVEVVDALVIDGTDTQGDALGRRVDRLSTTAIMTLKMADVRLQCKAALKRVGTPDERPGDALLAVAEKALKLVLNSLYGKTVQQVGSHKYYNDFAAAWITSTCRALLWRAIAPERVTDNVLMTMTDGLYSRVPLEFPDTRQSARLGDWEAEAFDYFETFKPGVYRYKDDKGMHYKVRGFLTPTDADREKLFSLTWAASQAGTIGKFPAKAFLTRNLALKGWKREPWCRQFYIDQKEIKSELRAKRDPAHYSGWLIPRGMSYTFFRPKRSHAVNNSKGYALAFETLDLIADDDELIDQFRGDYDARIGLEEYFEVE